MYGIKQLQSNLVNFLNDLAAHENELHNLAEFSQQMIAQGITQNNYSSFTMEAVTERWNRLKQQIDERQHALNEEEGRLAQNDELCKQFASMAKAFMDWIEKEKDAVARGTEGTLEQQLQALNERKKHVVANTTINDIVSFSNDMDQRNITFNLYTEESIETLNSRLENLIDLTNKQQALLEKEILNQSGSKISEQQLEEFKSTFKAFDKDRNGTLEAHEFAACLKALSQNMTDDQAYKLHATLGKTTPGKMTFQEFVDFMVSRTEDSDTARSVKNAFKIIAGDRNTVTEDDLKRVPGMTQETIAFLLQNIPKEKDTLGYMYESWTDGQYHK